MGSVQSKLPRRFRLAGVEAAPGTAVSVLGAPLGSLLTDGCFQISVAQVPMAVDVSRWRLNQLELKLPLDEPLPDLKALVLPSSSTGGQPRMLLPLKLVVLEEQQLFIQGLPCGAALTDGVNVHQSTGVEDTISVLEWNLAALILVPPKGWHQEMCLRIEPRGLSEPERDRLRCLRVRLVSANAFLSARALATPVPVETEFKLEFGQLEQEPKGGQLTISPQNPSFAFTSAGSGDAHLDAAALQLLEAKFRLH